MFDDSGYTYSAKFKDQHTFDKRVTVAQRLKEKYPDRLPVIVEKLAKSDAPDITKKKYLVPCDMPVSKFIYELRKQMRVKPESAIFVFVNNTMPPNSALMSHIYTHYHDDDGFLYITYSGENTFG